MYFSKLIAESKIEIAKSSIDFFEIKGFDGGGEWMKNKLNSSNNIKGSVYNKFGVLKYFLALLGFVISYALFDILSLEFVFSSIFLFYLIEVHFLFLFPLIIDNKKPLLLSSVKSTYSVGLFRAIFNVIPIGFYMMIGLLNFRKPFFNWYVGCNAILIWYEKEIRNRL